MIRGAAVLLLALLPLAAPAEPKARVLDFADLDGWSSDDHAAALKTFLVTCGDLRAPEWQAPCAEAAVASDARRFFETAFRPVLFDDGAKPLITGYYEPELDGARQPDARFRVPIYRKPPEFAPGTLFPTRAEIEGKQLLAGRGLEIVWLEDPVEAFFLHVQGSGRIRLPDGQVIRLGFAAKNGHPYRSIGQELVRRGIYPAHKVSAQVIRNWVRRNPVDGPALLHHNPSFIFFRELDLPPDLGPLGAMNRPVTPLRSIAVDPDVIPLGAPVWLEKAGKAPLRRLMVAQDTGSAIRGAQRADVFYGSGSLAGKKAGTVRDSGRVIVLLPLPRALALAGK